MNARVHLTLSSVTTQAAVSQHDGSVTVTMTVVICLMNKTAAPPLQHQVNTIIIHVTLYSFCWHQG